MRISCAAAVIISLGLLAGAASAGFLTFDGDEAGYRAALASYGIDTTIIGFDNLAKDDLVTDQYLNRGALFIAGNGGLNYLRVDNDMNDVPPISKPWAIQIEDVEGLLTEIGVQFAVPIRTMAVWHGDVAAKGGNVLRITPLLDGNSLGDLDFTNSKETARFVGIIATGGVVFNGASLKSMKTGDAWGIDNFEYERIIPEPTMVTLIGLAGIGALAIRRRR
jgi:hypothetical protein